MLAEIYTPLFSNSSPAI